VQELERELKPGAGCVLRQGQEAQVEACAKLSGTEVLDFEALETTADHLRAVAGLFVQAQEKRENARETAEAQEFLVLL
jgi:hypothetical protein